MMIWALLLSLVVLAESKFDCHQALTDLQLSDAGKIAHGIHSLTLNTLRYYFDPAAPADNGIPTINLDRSDPSPLHPDAIFVNLTNSHAYGPFFALDNVLSHMDDPNWGIKNANTLDQLGHDIHMHMLWQAASEKYHDMVGNSPPSSETCACLIDSYNNTIYHALGIMAKEIRTPELVVANFNNNTGNGKAMGVMGAPQIYAYCGCSRPTRPWWQFWKKDGQAATSNTAPGTFIPENQMIAITITNETTWDDWKYAMRHPSADFKQDVANHLAAYIYCKLNH